MTYSICVSGGIINYPMFQLGPINVNIHKGFITAIIGRNGAGKTTFLRGIVNERPFDAGTQRIEGLSYQTDRIELNRKVSYVSDHVNMYGSFSCREAIEFISACHENWDTQLEKKLVERFQLPLQKKVDDLSKGMKIKLNFLLGVCFHPTVLLLDEPTAGLDPLSRKEMLAVVQDFMLDETRTVLFSSHITTDFEQIADFIIYMKDGQIALTGSKEELVERYRYFSTREQHLNAKIEGYKRTKAGTVGVVCATEQAYLPHAEFRLPTLDELLEFVVETPTEVKE